MPTKRQYAIAGSALGILSLLGLLTGVLSNQPWPAAPPRDTTPLVPNAYFQPMAFEEPQSFDAAASASGGTSQEEPGEPGPPPAGSDEPADEPNEEPPASEPEECDDVDVSGSASVYVEVDVDVQAETG